MKVFVLEKVSVYEGCQDTTVRVYASRKQAKRFFKQLMQAAKEDFSTCDYEEDNYKEKDNAWSIWEAGSYCINHVSITIYEREVEYVVYNVIYKDENGNEFIQENSEGKTKFTRTEAEDLCCFWNETNLDEGEYFIEEVE